MSDDETGWVNTTSPSSRYEVAYHPSTDRWRHRLMREPDFHSNSAFRPETPWFPGKPHGVRVGLAEEILR
jgi:hypothetical protein